MDIRHKLIVTARDIAMREGVVMTKTDTGFCGGTAGAHAKMASSLDLPPDGLKSLLYTLGAEIRWHLAKDSSFGGALHLPIYDRWFQGWNGDYESVNFDPNDKFFIIDEHVGDAMSYLVHSDDSGHGVSFASAGDEAEASFVCHTIPEYIELACEQRFAYYWPNADARLGDGLTPPQITEALLALPYKRDREVTVDAVQVGSHEDVFRSWCQTIPEDKLANAATLVNSSETSGAGAAAAVAQYLANPKGRVSLKKLCNELKMGGSDRMKKAELLAMLNPAEPMAVLHLSWTVREPNEDDYYNQASPCEIMGWLADAPQADALKSELGEDGLALARFEHARPCDWVHFSHQRPFRTALIMPRRLVPDGCVEGLRWRSLDG